MILIVYVNDIILTCDDFKEHEHLKNVLAMEFEIKDLGQLHYFLGDCTTKKGILISWIEIYSWSIERDGHDWL